VLSFNKKTQQTEWDKIIDAISIDVNKKDKIRVVGEGNFDITTSDWHPFFVLEKIKVDKKCPICGKKVNGVRGFAGHLRYNKVCKQKYNKMFKYKVVEKRADELKKGDYILQNFMNMYPKKESKFNNELMWLIGLYISDGSISKYIDNRGGNNLKKYKLRINKKDKTTLLKAKNIMNKYFGNNISVLQNDKRSSSLHELSTSKKETVDFFLNLGFKPDKKVYTISVPSIVKENITKHNIYSLLSGLIDGDGHITKKNGEIEYYTVSEALAYDLVEICSIIGIKIAKFDKRNKRKNEVNGFIIKIPSYEVTKIKPKLDIVHNIDNIKDELSNRKKNHLPTIRVKETTKVEVEDNLFYDLTTEKNHNYLAGNNTMVFIHNTVLHLFLGERLQGIESTKKLVKRVAENFNLPYDIYQENMNTVLYVMQKWDIKKIKYLRYITKKR